MRYYQGTNLIAGLEFWTFFQPQIQGFDLYVEHLICGYVQHSQHTS